MKTPTLLSLILLASVIFCSQVAANTKPIQVKVFIAAMFEIGAHSDDKAGEFQHWYQCYFNDSQPINVKGALKPVYCNNNGVCGGVLGMGKVVCQIVINFTASNTGDFVGEIPTD